ENPTPTFGVRNARVSVRKRFGKDQSHLRLLLENRVEGIYWRGASRLSTDRMEADVVFQVEVDGMTGRPVLNIKDLGRLF
ncbi:MAG: hypothetical protein ACLGPL_02655, partial [Acidobacteriota bacterium]